MLDPVEDASALVQRVYALLLEARQTRERLTTMQTTDGASEAERVMFLGMISTFEDGLRRTLEEAIVTIKRMRGDEAKAWLRRQEKGLTP